MNYGHYNIFCYQMQQHGYTEFHPSSLLGNEV